MSIESNIFIANTPLLYILSAIFAALETVYVTHSMYSAITGVDEMLSFIYLLVF
jgi:hypothetical protein